MAQYIKTVYISAKDAAIIKEVDASVVEEIRGKTINSLTTKEL